jgi:hypothetical protein
VVPAALLSLEVDASDPHAPITAEAAMSKGKTRLNVELDDGPM